MKGYCDYPGHVGDFHNREKICRNWRQALPVHVDHLVTEMQIEVAPKAETPEQTIERLNKRIRALQQELGAVETKYDQLNQIYNKLADQWNVFQATNRPDNRNIQRAEGAGEMARKLAEVLLGVAYSTDVRDLLQKILQDMDGAGGQEVESYAAGRLATAKRLVPDTQRIVCAECGELTSKCRCG